MDRDTVLIRRGTPQDAELLAELGARTFADTFGSQNTPEDLTAYLNSAFTPEVMREELNNAGNAFFLAFLDDKPAGYIKLRQGNAPSCVRGPQPIELERIYVTAEVAGRGIGGQLKDRVLAEARQRGFKTIWLGVWKENHQALQIYHRWGFKIAGEQTFTMGEDIQFDWVMARPIELSPAGPIPT